MSIWVSLILRLAVAIVLVGGFHLIVGVTIEYAVALVALGNTLGLQCILYDVLLRKENENKKG
ncbi:MAG: hypothetical protein KAS32_30740 [Candidatus Peribacteraceae bacterium]|nr:hypothetical protein [Candidatus Peribacteraceae bacterium]